MNTLVTTLKNIKEAAMNILDKFSSVEIKADNRISDADRAFCVQHQEAFDKAGPALEKVAEAIVAAKTEQQAILGSDDSEYSYLSPWGVYISSNKFKCDESAVYEMIKKRSERFITEIVNYFQGKYTLELDGDKIKKNLIPAPPKEPKLPWGGYCSMTSEEVDAFKEKLTAHKAEMQKYEDDLRVHPIRYEQIVDEIFVQLSGFSFQERAMNEFLEKCWDAAHNYHGDKENFEIKNDTLRLTGYWCRCRNESWMSEPEWSTGEDLRIILNALVHFDIGQMNRGTEWFPALFRYSTNENVFPINNLMKVKNIKLFKNGRVDIKFKDAVSVLEFVEGYLRKRVG